MITRKKRSNTSNFFSKSANDKTNHLLIFIYNTNFLRKIFICKKTFGYNLLLEDFENFFYNKISGC